MKNVNRMKADILRIIEFAPSEAVPMLRVLARKPTCRLSEIKRATMPYNDPKYKKDKIVTRLVKIEAIEGHFEPGSRRLRFRLSKIGRKAVEQLQRGGAAAIIADRRFRKRGAEAHGG